LAERWVRSRGGGGGESRKIGPHRCGERKNAKREMERYAVETETKREIQLDRRGPDEVKVKRDLGPGLRPHTWHCLAPT
jgi:hypothetical protein